MFSVGKLSLIVAALFSSAAIAASNGGAPEVGAGNTSRVYACNLSDGTSVRPAELTISLNAGQIIVAQLNVRYIEAEIKFDETMTVAISGPMKRTTNGQIGVRRGRVPILSRADLQEFSFPGLRNYDFRSLPDQIDFRYNSVTGPVGQTGGNSMTGVCTLKAVR